MIEVADADPRWTELQNGILGWAEAQSFDFPWRREMPKWQALVSEVLLQRTRAKSVAAIYDQFFDTYDSPARLGAASEAEVRGSIWSLGLLWRAKYLRELGEALTASDVPASVDELTVLPGVGPYAAGAYLALHQNIPAVLVDANVVRLLSRFWGFDYDGETRRKRWFLRLVDRLFKHDSEPRVFGYALLDFTREICGTAPRCAVCPVAGQCAYGTVAEVRWE